MRLKLKLMLQVLKLKLFVHSQFFIKQKLLFALLKLELYPQLIFASIFKFKLKLFTIMAAS